VAGHGQLLTDAVGERCGEHEPKIDERSREPAPAVDDSARGERHDPVERQLVDHLEYEVGDGAEEPVITLADIPEAATARGSGASVRSSQHGR